MLKYYPAKSFLHSLDCRAKIIALAVLIALFVALPLTYSAIALPFALSLWLAARIPFKKIFKQKFLLLVALASFAFRLAYEKSFYNGVVAGVFNACYALGIILLAELLVFTSRNTALRKALLWLRLPKRIAFAFSLALQALPSLQDKALRVRIAQQSRGVRRRDSLALLAPVLHGVFTRAKKLSIALESRGFDAEKI
ncbi:MAG: energy-coupling factor transporter transmembrane component T [Candidatus Norongarragalinales archaeon]